MLPALCIAASAAFVAFLHAVATAPLGWEDPEGFHEGEQPDLWLARVARGALNSHSTDLSREAQQNNVA